MKYILEYEQVVNVKAKINGLIERKRFINKTDTRECSGEYIMRVGQDSSKFNTVQYSTVQYSTVQYSTGQYSITQ